MQPNTHQHLLRCPPDNRDVEQALIKQVVENVKHLACNVNMHLGTKETQLVAAAACGYVGKKAKGSVNRDLACKDTYLALLDNEVVDVRFVSPPARP